MDNMLHKIICRTCLTEASGYKSLLSKMAGDDRTLLEVLSNFTNMDILLNDMYPKQVCDECCTMIFKADEFKKRCLQSETILKNGLLSHTFEKLIKREISGTVHANGADSQINTNIISNNYYDDSVKNNHTGTGEIEIALVENYYNNSTDNQKYDITCVKEEHDDFLRDDISDLADSEVFENSPGVDNIYNTGKTIDVTNLKNNTKECDNLVDKAEVDINAYQCTVCYEEFSNSELLHIHTLVHNENNVDNENYHCTVCNSNFKCKVSLKSHIKRHKLKAKHKKTKSSVENKNGLTLLLICPKCEEKFTTIESFQSHLKTHKKNQPDVVIDNIIKLNNEIQNYQCSLCMRKFVRRSSLVTHIKRHEERAQNKYTCKTCKREFQHKAHLENHVVLVHSKEKGFMCSICNNSFSTQESLDSHKDRHKVDRKHECKVCGKSFTMLSTLTEHIKIHTGEKPYLCSVCGRGFSQKNNMTQHMRRHQGLKPFKCDTCERGFVSKGELDAHARKHSGAHPFVCDDCGGSFTTSSSLTKHRRIHTGERPYACDLCPMRFTALNTLKNHRRTHTGEKPYQCSHCEKAFTQRNDLVSHIRCHTGERPYICTCCGQAFRKASALKVHVKVHSREGMIM